MRAAGKSGSTQSVAQHQANRHSAACDRDETQAAPDGYRVTHSNKDCGQQSSAPADEAVAALAALCPEGLSPQFLRHVLLKHHGKIEVQSANIRVRPSRNDASPVVV